MCFQIYFTLNNDKIFGLRKIGQGLALDFFVISERLCKLFVRDLLYTSSNREDRLFPSGG